LGFLGIDDCRIVGIEIEGKDAPGGGIETVGPGFLPVDRTSPIVAKLFVSNIVNRAALPLLIKPRPSCESMTVK
jgi:hypothetical protein